MYMPCFALCAWNIFVVSPTAGMLIRIVRKALKPFTVNYIMLFYCKYTAYYSHYKAFMCLCVRIFKPCSLYVPYAWNIRLFVLQVISIIIDIQALIVLLFCVHRCEYL